MPLPAFIPAACARRYPSWRSLAPAVAAALLLGACSGIGPKPWERDLMAKPAMALDAAAIDAAIDDHVYFSKEGASGGRGFGGGGCGCN